MSPFPKPALGSDQTNEQDIVNSLHEQMKEALAAEDIQAANEHHSEVFHLIDVNEKLLIELLKASPENMTKWMRAYEEAITKSKHIEEAKSIESDDERAKDYNMLQEIVEDTQLILKRTLEKAFNSENENSEHNKKEVRLEDIDIVIPQHFFSLDQELKGYYEDFLEKARKFEMLTSGNGGMQFKELCRQFIWGVEVKDSKGNASSIPKDLYSSIVGGCLLYLLSEPHMYYVDMSSSNDNDWKVYCVETADYEDPEKNGSNSDEEIQARMQTNLQKVSIYERSTLGELHKIAIADVVHGNDFDKAHIDQLFDDMIQKMAEQKEIQSVNISGIMMYIRRGDEGKEYESIPLSIEEKGEVYQQLYKKICWGSLGSAEMNDMRSKLSEQQFIFLDGFLAESMEKGKAKISNEGDAQKRWTIDMSPEDFLLLIAEEYLEEKFLAGSEWRDLFGIKDFLNEFYPRMNIRVTTENIQEKFEESLVNLLIRNEKVESLRVSGGVIYRVKRIGQVESNGLIEKIINQDGFFVEGKRVYLPFFLEIGEILAERRYPERGELGDLERMHKWLYSELNRKFSDLQVPREAIRVIHVIIKKWMEIGLLSKEDEKGLSAEERKQRMYRLLEEILKGNSEDTERMTKTSALLESILAAAKKKGEALEVAKGRAEGLTKNEYTEDSWLVLQTALEMVETTNGDIVAKTAAINDAIKGLVFAGQAALNFAVLTTSGGDEEDYTPETWTILVFALALAETTNEKIIAKTKAISDAAKGLEYAGQAALNIAVGMAKGLLAEDYTEDSRGALDDALGLPEMTNAEIVVKTMQIEAAIRGLIYVGQAELESVKTSADGLTESDYTTDSWSALGSARLMPEGKANIAAKIVAIKDAIDLLITVSASNDLAEAIRRAGSPALRQIDYTPETWEVLQSVLTTMPETRNSEIEAKTIAINDAIRGLIFAGQAAFETVRTMAVALIASDYTPGTWLILQDALRMPERTNAYIEAKTIAIENAIAGLVTISAYETEINRIVSDMVDNDKSPWNRLDKNMVKAEFVKIVTALQNNLTDTVSGTFTVVDWLEKAEEIGVAEGLYDVYVYIQGKTLDPSIVDPEKREYRNALQSIQKIFDHIYETKAYTVMHRKYEEYISNARGGNLDTLKKFNETYLRYPLESDITGEFKKICKTFLPETYGNHMILVRDDENAYNFQKATSEEMFFRVLEEMIRKENDRHTSGLVPLTPSGIARRRPGARLPVERSDFHLSRGASEDPLEEYDTEEKIKIALVKELSDVLELSFPEIRLLGVTTEQLLWGLGYANDSKGDPRAVTAEELKQIIVKKIDKRFSNADVIIVEKFLEMLFEMGLVMKNDTVSPTVYMRTPRRGGIKEYANSKKRGEIINLNHVLENESQAKAKIGEEIEKGLGLFCKGKKELSQKMTEIFMQFYEKSIFTGKYILTVGDEKTTRKISRRLEKSGLFRVSVDEKGAICITPNFSSARHALFLIRENSENWIDRRIVGIKKIRRGLGRSMNQADEKIMNLLYGKDRFREEELLVFEYPEWRNLNGNPLSIMSNQPELMNRAASDAYTIIDQLWRAHRSELAVAGELSGLLIDIKSDGIKNIYEIISVCEHFNVKLPPSIFRLRALFEKQLHIGVKQYLNSQSNRLDGCTGTIAQCLGVKQKMEIIDDLRDRKPSIIISEQLAMLDKILTDKIDLFKISEGMYAEITDSLTKNLKLDFEDRKEQLEVLCAARMKKFLEFVIQQNGYVLYNRDPTSDDVIASAKDSVKKVREMGIDELYRSEKDSSKLKKLSEPQKKERAENMRYYREYWRIIDSSKLKTEIDITDKSENLKIGFEHIKIDASQGIISGKKSPKSGPFTIAIGREEVKHPDKMIEAILDDWTEGLNQKQKIYLIWEYIKLFIVHMYGGADGKSGMGNIRGEWGGKKYILRVENGSVELIFEGPSGTFFNEKKLKKDLFDGGLDDMPGHLTTVMVLFRQSQDAIEQTAKKFFDAKYNDTMISLKNIDKKIQNEVEVFHSVGQVKISEKKKGLRLVLKNGKEANTHMSLRFGMICDSPCLVRIDGEIYELESRTAEADGENKQYKIKKKRKSIGAYMEENRTNLSREVMRQYTHDMVKTYLMHPEFVDQKRNRKIYFSYGGKRYECSIDASGGLVVNEISTASGRKDFMYMADEEYRRIESNIMTPEDKKAAREARARTYPGIVIDMAEDYKFAMYDSREGTIASGRGKQIVRRDRPLIGVPLNTTPADSEVFRGDTEFQTRLLKYILDSIRVKKKK